MAGKIRPSSLSERHLSETRKKAFGHLSSFPVILGVQGILNADALDAHKGERNEVVIQIFETQFNHLPHTLHQGIERLRLGMAASKLRHGCDEIAFCILLNDDVELLGRFH